MRVDERTILTHGLWAIPLIPNVVIPEEAVTGAGYVAGIPRLDMPTLNETDASLSVSYVAIIFATQWTCRCPTGRTC